jgi:GxxExxY protein
VIVEIKAVDKLIKVHDQQILAYLRATKIRAGLLMNFGAPLLSQGLKRFVI